VLDLIALLEINEWERVYDLMKNTNYASLQRYEMG